MAGPSISGLGKVLPKCLGAGELCAFEAPISTPGKSTCVTMHLNQRGGGEGGRPKVPQLSPHSSHPNFPKSNGLLKCDFLETMPPSTFVRFLFHSQETTATVLSLGTLPLRPAVMR